MLDTDYAEIVGKLTKTERMELGKFIKMHEVDNYLRKTLQHKAITLELSSSQLTLYNIGCLESLNELLQIHNTESAVTR